MKKVIFDTDIGIDDAMALLFLEYSPEVELRAVVTGFGNASIENTTRNALYMRERFGVDVPVYRGAALGLDNDPNLQYPDFVHGTNGLGDIEIVEPTGSVEEMAGAEAIVNMVREEPGELSIVAVGRMTNLAHALVLCPELHTLVKEVVVMGGAFGGNGHHGNLTPFAEANIGGDSLAAQQVFASQLPITIVGLDVTEETIAQASFFDHLRGTAKSAGEFIYDISRCYLDFQVRTQSRNACPIHDSSAVAYLLQPELFVTSFSAVSVATSGERNGQTSRLAPALEDDGSKLCGVCTDVDAQAVLDLYESVLTSV